ncbi:MAG: MFS transporter [Rhodoglobus sp.]
MPNTSPAPQNDLQRRQLAHWRNAIFVIFLVSGLAIASWMSRLPAARDNLDMSSGQVGLLIVGISVGSILGLVASSRIVARFGTVATISWGIVGAVLGILIAGFGVTIGPSFILAFVGLMLFGCALGITDVAMNVSGAANERAIGRAIMPLFHAFFSFGTMLGAGLGALAELAGLPIALHLVLIGGIIVVSMLLVRRFIHAEETVEEENEKPQPQIAADPTTGGWHGRLGAWRDPKTLLIGLLALAAGFSEGSANDWLAIASVDGHGVSNETGALIFGAFVTAMTLGRLGGVALLNRFGRVVVLRGSFMVASIGLVLFIFVPNIAVAIVGVVLWGAGSALGAPIAMSAAADDPKIAAARVSAVATLGYLAFLVGPPAIGLLGEHTGVLHALLIVLALAAIGSLIAGAAREPQRSAR